MGDGLMTDALVKQLRAAGRAFINNQYNLHTRAADRIEELERSRQHWQDCYTRKTQHELEVRARIEELEAALQFYKDGFRYHPKRTSTGINLSEWKPTEELLNDCGEIARAVLAGEKTNEP